MLLLLAAMALPATPTSALVVELTTSNDFLSGADQADDLYTAGLVLDLRWGEQRFTVGERLFTDRDRGLRFDETYATVDLRVRDLGRWTTWLDVGLLHVGRGLLGADAQNAVHRLFDMEEVDLDYVNADRYHPTVEFGLERRLLGDAHHALHARATAFAAPGFRSWLRVGVAGRWQVSRTVAVHAGVGAMANQVDFAALAARVDDLAATWEIGVAYRGFVANWTYNRYGTEARHGTFGYRFGVGGKTPGTSGGLN